jgi:small subunit ribosomal protein S7
MSEEIKLFGKWPFDIKILDKGLERYINLNPKIIPKSCGRYAKQQFSKSKMNIVERFITHLMVPGHKGKKHVLTSGRVVGRWQTTYKIVEKAFDRIYEITKKNPLEVFVRAVENAAIREEIAAYQVGGIIVRKAVVTSPQRRVDTALRHIAQAAYRKAFGKKANMVDALVEEIIGAYENNPTKSEAIREKERIEKEAEGAR